jgi:CubicO group peptidase (beta-lactamase class C family)
LARSLDRTAVTTQLSGAVSIDVDGSPVLARGYGLADRMLRIPNTPDTRFGVATVSQAFTALTVMSLVEDGTLSLQSRVRPMLSTDLPHVHPQVTLEHLLSHTSGIGNYPDGNHGEVTDQVPPVPTHHLATTEGFLPVLEDRSQVFEPGERFEYNKGGYIVVALAVERASGVPFHDLVRQRVFAPAALQNTGFPRMDERPANMATGYLRDDSVRTNVLHLPVRGNGDGGAVTTIADLSRFWRALVDGQIVSEASVAELVRPRQLVPEETARYGLGFWLDLDGRGYVLGGQDAGVSVYSRFEPESRTTVTIVSNDTEGALPVIRRYEDWLRQAR